MCNTYQDEARTIIKGLRKIRDIKASITGLDAKDQDDVVAAMLMCYKQRFACSFRPKKHLHREVFLVTPEAGKTVGEHIVPIDTAWVYAATLDIECSKTIDKLAAYICDHVGVKVHITNQQAAIVNCSKQNYKHAKNRMPEGWKPGQCPSVRYACLGSSVVQQLQSQL